jgi:hypothetical protein
MKIIYHAYPSKIIGVTVGHPLCNQNVVMKKVYGGRYKKYLQDFDPKTL